MIDGLALNQSWLGFSFLPKADMAKEWMASLKMYHPEVAPWPRGVLEGFLEDPQVFALTLRVSSPGTVYAGTTFLVSLAAAWLDCTRISVAIGAVVTESGENVRQAAASSGDD